MHPTPIPIKGLAALFSLVLLASATGAQAQELPPPPSPPAEGVPAAAAPAPALTNAVDLQPRIPEGLTPGARDPFWPVGYAPKSAAEIEREKALAEAALNKVGGPKWSEARASLRIGGYMKTAEGYAALVNNSVVTTSDIVSLVFDGKLYRWKVEMVSADGISFAQLDWMSIAPKPKTSGKDRP